MKKNFLFLSAFFICIFAHLHISSFAQDSSRIRISLLTCSPGEELYSTFGHSAMRVIDSNSVTDHVYNYGTFDFEDPDFYTKFIRGKLKYFVSVTDFQDFKSEYVLSNRSMKEQVLNFSAIEKIRIKQALIENLKEENKFYMYDFFLDNCTTRLRDLMGKNHPSAFQLPAVMPADYTFRNAIHQYLDANHKYWSKLGIDILLGAPTDAVMTTQQQQFLPENLMLALDKAKKTASISGINNLYIVEEAKNDNSFFTPGIFFTGILLLFLVLSFFRNTTAKRILFVLDGLLFFSVGALGIILVLMWTATDHSMTKNNYNILWAWPLHIIYAFMFNKKSAKLYSRITCVFLLLVLLCWHFFAQDMNNALFPLVLLLAVRTAVKGFNRRGAEIQS